MIAWRGVVINGDVWAWPLLLWTHQEADMKVPVTQYASCVWRQWNEGDDPDFDPGASDEDKSAVRAFLTSLSR